MSEVIRTLGEVLVNIEAAPWNYALYVDPERPWRENTLCVVLDPDDIDDPNSDDPPELAKQHGLRYALLVSDTQDIVANTKQQKAAPTTAEIIRAFSYYYDHDAYMDF